MSIAHMSIFKDEGIFGMISISAACMVYLLISRATGLCLYVFPLLRNAIF